MVKHARSSAIWSAYSLATPATPSDFAIMFASGVHICSASSAVNAKSSIPGRAATIALVVSSNIFNWDESTLPAAFFLAALFFLCQYREDDRVSFSAVPPGHFRAHLP